MLEVNIRIVESFPVPYFSIELRLPAIHIIPSIATAQGNLTILIG